MENMDIMANSETIMDSMDVEMEETKTQESDNLIGNSLLRLDDMVLRRIMKYSSADDLVNLSETCVRLANLSEEHFRKHYRSINWSTHDRRIEPAASERFLKKCGKHVKNVKFSYWNNDEFFELLLILAKHCQNLDTLSLEHVNMPRPIMPYSLIDSMFAKLQRFEFIDCFWTDWCPLTYFFGDNSTLEQLMITKCFMDNRYSYQLQLSGFSALKRLDVVHCKNVLTNFELEECFLNNKITSLALSDINGISIFNSELIDTLVDTLESLTIDCTNFDLFDQLLRLKKLKVLRIHSRKFINIDSELLKFTVNNIIEELEISHLIISNETVKALATFKSLTRLRLNRCQNTVPDKFFKSLPQLFPQLLQFVYTYSEIKDKNIFCMVKMMPTLRRLSLFGCNKLRTETYLEIENVFACNWQRPKLEFIPPMLVTMKTMNDVKKSMKNIWLRTDLVNYFCDN